MSKNIKTLFIVFVVLVAIAFAPKIKEMLSKDEPVKKSQSIDLSIFTPETVQLVTIKQGEETRTLKLKDNVWQINDELADQNKVGLFFDELEQTEISKLVSKNQENHSNFDISKDDGLVVTFASQADSSTFVVGKAGPGPGTFYIRKEGFANVYLAQSMVRTNLIQETDDWKEDPPLEEDSDAIEGAQDMDALEGLQ